EKLVAGVGDLTAALVADGHRRERPVGRDRLERDRGPGGRGGREQRETRKQADTATKHEPPCSGKGVRQRTYTWRNTEASRRPAGYESTPASGSGASSGISTHSATYTSGVRTTTAVSMAIRATRGLTS